MDLLDYPEERPDYEERTGREAHLFGRPVSWWANAIVTHPRARDMVKGLLLVAGHAALLPIRTRELRRRAADMLGDMAQELFGAEPR